MPSEARRCLVTGGAGFVGSWWVRHLLAAGCSVTVLDNFATGQRLNIPVEARVIEGDATDPRLMNRWVRRVDTVFHFASFGIKQAAHDPLTTLTGNILSSLSTITACAYHQRELVLISSAGVYGRNAGTLISETDDTHMATPPTGAGTYGLSKLVDEALALAWRAETNQTIKIVRLFPCIGPRQARAYERIVPRFIVAALQGKPIKIYGNGDDRLSFVYIQDALAGIDLVWQRGEPGLPYNLGGAEQLTTNELAARVLQLTGSSSPIRHLSADLTPPLPAVPDLARICGLGYEPRFSLDDALRAIIAFYRGKP